MGTNRRDFLGQLAGFPAAVAAQSLLQGTAPRFMYVGSFTSDGRGRGEGLSVFHRRTGSDAWTRIQILKTVNPSFLKIDRQGRFLYSAHGDGDEVSSYAIEALTGRLTVVNRQPTRGRNGVHLDIDPTNRFLVVANYASGTLVALPILTDGSLGAVCDLATLEGEPGPHRTQQTGAHPHHCPFDPTGRAIVVPDKGLDRIFVYRLDSGSGRLVAGTPPSVASRAGAGPRHVDFHPSGRYAYVINELDSTMTTYRFDPEKTVLQPIQISTTLPPTYTANNTTAEVVVAPSGRFVYGSNRGHDSVVLFSVAENTGALTAVAWESTQGRTPRFFGLDPTGAFLYAANQDSDTVVIFQVDDTTGRLRATGEVVSVASPCTIGFR
jgi:6-phosphogluconolactonase (cycloisomerase 2 family)